MSNIVGNWKLHNDRGYTFYIQNLTVDGEGGLTGNIFISPDLSGQPDDLIGWQTFKSPSQVVFMRRFPKFPESSQFFIGETASDPVYGTTISGTFYSIGKAGTAGNGGPIGWKATPIKPSKTSE